MDPSLSIQNKLDLIKLSHFTKLLENIFPHVLALIKARPKPCQLRSAFP